MVNIKLAFMDWFFCNLIILIKQRKMPYTNLDKVLLFSRNQVVFLKNWELRPTPTTAELIIFSPEISHWNFSYLGETLQKGVWNFFFFSFCVDLELIIKIKKTWFIRTRFFKFLLITQDISRNIISNMLLKALLSAKCT